MCWPCSRWMFYSNICRTRLNWASSSSGLLLLLPQGGAAVHPQGAGGAVRAVLPEVPGERPPGPGAGGRAAGPAAVPAREPGAQRPQPGAPPWGPNLQASPDVWRHRGVGRSPLQLLALSPPAPQPAAGLAVWRLRDVCASSPVAGRHGSRSPAPTAGTVFKHLPVETIRCSHLILSDYSLKMCLLLRKLGYI